MAGIPLLGGQRVGSAKVSAAGEYIGSDGFDVSAGITHVAASGIYELTLSRQVNVAHLNIQVSARSDFGGGVAPSAGWRATGGPSTATFAIETFSDGVGPTDLDFCVTVNSIF